MRGLPFIGIIAIFFNSIAAANSDIPIQKYIDQYSAIAVEEMHRTGIPASITLAQGIVESRWGTSQLAVRSNNHFGIKCKGNWSGGKHFYKDDDYVNGKLVKSCFRTYESPEASYLDHSEFLMTNSRYQSLFNLPKTDYKSWAKGLKKAGYATDRNYAKNLIVTIEKYQLHRFDYELEEAFVKEELIAPQAELIPDFVEAAIVQTPPPATYLIPDNYQRGDGLKEAQAIEQNNFYKLVYGRSSESYLDEISPRKYLSKD